MPGLDANKGSSRSTQRTLNKARAKRVKKARRTVTTPPGSYNVPQPKPAIAGPPAPKRPVAGPPAPKRVAPKNPGAYDVKKPTAGPPAPKRSKAVGTPAADLGRGATTAAQKKYAVAEVKKLIKTGGSLTRKEKAIHELARLGILTPEFRTGLDDRADAAARDQEIENEKVRIARDAAPADASTLAGRIELSRRKDAAATPAAKAAKVARIAKVPTSKRETRFSPELASAVGGFVPGVIKSAGALVEGTARDPIGVPTKTAKQGATAIAAMPAALVAMVTQPGKTADAIVEDYSKRNNEDYDDKLARVRKEGGFFEAVDVSLAASVGGGAAAKSALIAKAPARAGKLHSGGAVKVPKKGGPVRYYTGRAIDNKKAKKYERIAARAERGKGPGLTPLQNEALAANRAAGRTVVVVPRRSGRKVAKVVAGVRGKAVAGLKYATAKGAFAKLAREKYKLNAAEIEALWLGTEVGIRDAATARAVGQKLRNKMARERGDYTPSGWERDMDVIAQIDRILLDPEKHFTPRFAAAMDRIHEHAKAVSAMDPRFKDITKETRRRAAQAYALDLKQGEGLPAPKPRITAAEVASGRTATAVPELKYADESPAAFNARVDAEALKAGLRPPTYFRSEKQQGLQADFGAHVVGGGSAKSTGKAYEGKNLGQGIFDTTFDQFLRGYAHNLKAAHNYPLVAKLDDKNRLREFSPDSQPQGKELGALMNDVNRAEPRIKKDSIVFVNKELFERHIADAAEGGRHLDEADGLDELGRNALEGAVIREGATPDPKLVKTSGWVAWPKEALRELEAEMNAGTAGGRAFDIAKGATSKAILLTGNLPWLAIQTAAEFASVGVATKGRGLTPRNMVATQRWWKAMNEKQRTHVSTELGLGATGSDTAAIKMGATTNNRLVDAWRDFKAEDFWHRPRVAGLPVATIISPVKWMRAADTGKTNVARLLHGHAELTKRITPEGQSALAGALDSMSKFGKNADRLLPTWKAPTPEQLAFLEKNPGILEKMGDDVANALGDWTTMTAKERQWANRFVMFYPFVRYSTRLLFHTLPVDHPAVTSVLAELGALKADEYRDIFGDDDLPWNIGKIYFGKTGESEYIDLSRAHPIMNSMVQGAARLGTSSENIGGVPIGMMPPYFAWAVDQITGVSTFKNRNIRFDGATDPFRNKFALDANHAELLAAQVQSLIYPTREYFARKHPEAQSDDSFIFKPEPMQYKDVDEIPGNSQDAVIRRAQARNAEANEQHARKNNGGWLDIVIGPLAPRGSRDKKSSEERRYVKKLKAAQEKTAAENKAYRDAHGGKNKPKPKAFGPGGGGKPFGPKSR